MTITYGEDQLEYEITQTWWDGTPINTHRDKLDGIFYRRQANGLFYKLIIDGPVPLSVFGAKGDGKTDNAPVFRKLNQAIPDGYSVPLFLGPGTFYSTQALDLMNKPVYLSGVSGSWWAKNATKILVPDGMEGIRVGRKDTSYQGTIIERLIVQAQGKTVPQHDGIPVRGICTIRDVTIHGFSHNGLGVWASIDQGFDASGSIFTNVRCQENGRSGFYLGGTDANGCNFYGCNAADNNFNGFQDESFLGNFFSGCMAHNNKDGHYSVEQATAATSFSGCYGESGSPPSYIHPTNQVAVVNGGIHENKWEGGGTVPGHMRAKPQK